MKIKKLKPVIVDRDTYRLMQSIWGHKIPYNPTMREEGGEKKNGTHKN